eukprot:s2456_g7.t1
MIFKKTLPSAQGIDQSSEKRMKNARQSIKRHAWPKAAPLCRIEMDVAAMSAALSACALGRRWSRSVQVFSSLRFSRHTPDAVAQGSLVEAFADGCWRQALSCMKRQASDVAGAPLVAGSYRRPAQK